jgi:transketolase
MLRAQSARPSLILVRTHIGYGSPAQDSFKAHGSPLGTEGVRKTKQKLGWPTEPEFLIPDEALAHFRKAVERGAHDEAAWNERMSAYAKAFPDLCEELLHRLRDGLPAGWDADIPDLFEGLGSLAATFQANPLGAVLLVVLAAIWGQNKNCSLRHAKAERTVNLRRGHALRPEDTFR